MENLKNIDLAKFERKIKFNDITNIGQELKFQREFYNFMNPTQKLVLKSENEKTSFNLGKKLAEFIQVSTNSKIPVNLNNVPNGLSYDVLSNIEKNNINDNDGHNSVYSLNIYYDKIYYLFKLYGFIKEDYNIFILLNKYGLIAPNRKKDNINNLINKSNEIHKETNKNLIFNLKSGGILVQKKDIEYLLTNESNYIFLLNKDYYEFLLKPFNESMIVIQFKDFKKLLKSKFSLLKDIERKCLSLYLGHSTSFIDDILYNRSNEITLYTLEEILVYFELDKTDLFFFVQNRLNKYTQFNNKKVVIHRQKDIKKFN